jgi:WD40 repeat protein
MAEEVPLRLPSPYHSRKALCSLSPDGSFLIGAEVDPEREPPDRLFCHCLDKLKSSVWSIKVSRGVHAPPLFLAGGEQFVLFEWRWKPAHAGTGLVLVTRESRTGKIRSAVTPSDDRDFYCPVLSADRRLIAARRNRFVVVFHADNLGAEATLLRSDNRKEFTGLAFHPSGRFLAATSNDKTVKFYDTTNWTVAHAFDWEIGRLRSIAFSPDGMLAAAGGDKGKIVVWDVDL